MTVRFRHMNFASQAKLASLFGLATALPIFLLLGLGDLGGLEIFSGGRGFETAPVTTFVALVIVSLLFALGIALLQLLALALLRLLPWQGPSLTLAERPDLEHIFE